MKRVLLLSVGLIFMTATYVGCLPSDSGTGSTPGTGGSGPGRGGSNPQGTAGTLGTGGSGNAGGDNGTGTGGDASGTAGDNGTGTGGSTTGTGGSATGTGGNGTGGNGTGGNGTGGNGTGGNGTGNGGRGGNNGTAGSGTGGTNPRGGAGGSAGARGGAGGTGGSAAGTTGTGGTAGTMGTGGTGNVAMALDGAMFLGPCIADTQKAVCATVNGACPDQNDADIALRGVKTTDKTITLGGTAGTTYTIVLHVQGEVESKNYSGGTDQSTAGSSPKLDGWRVGGTPNTGNAYNVYMIRVTNPGATTHTDYFLNSLDPPGVENHTSYGIDYTTPSSGALALTAQGGATLRLVAADSNCSMIKNCGPTANDGNTCAAPIIMSGIEPTAISKNTSFNFNTAYNGQWIVVTVKSVTP